MSQGFLSRREFMLGKTGGRRSSASATGSLASMRLAPAVGAGWTVAGNSLRIMRTGEDLACRKQVSEIELQCLMMMDGSTSLEEIVAEMSHRLNEDAASVRDVVFGFARWALDNGLLRSVRKAGV